MPPLPLPPPPPPPRTTATCNAQPSSQSVRLQLSLPRREGGGRGGGVYGVCDVVQRLRCRRAPGGAGGALPRIPLTLFNLRAVPPWRISNPPLPRIPPTQFGQPTVSHLRCPSNGPDNWRCSAVTVQPAAPGAGAGWRRGARHAEASRTRPSTFLPGKPAGLPAERPPPPTPPPSRQPCCGMQPGGRVLWQGAGGRAGGRRASWMCMQRSMRARIPSESGMPRAFFCLVTALTTLRHLSLRSTSVRSNPKSDFLRGERGQRELVAGATSGRGVRPVQLRGWHMGGQPGPRVGQGG